MARWHANLKQAAEDPHPIIGHGEDASSPAKKVKVGVQPTAVTRGEMKRYCRFWTRYQRKGVLLKSLDLSEKEFRPGIINLGFNPVSSHTVLTYDLDMRIQMATRHISQK